MQAITTIGLDIAKSVFPGMTDKSTPLYVICSPCRRVGKILVSRLLAEFYVVNDRPVAAFDLADEGPQLADYLPGITTIADIADTRGVVLSSRSFFSSSIQIQGPLKPTVCFGTNCRRPLSYRYVIRSKQPRRPTRAQMQT